MTIVQPIRQINERVWQVRYNEQLYMMKYYPNKESLQKVLALYKRLQHLQFPHSLSVEKVVFDHYLLQPWLTNCKAIRYHTIEDRTDTLKVLHKLHHIGKNINPSSIPSMQTYHLVEKWSHRLFRFQQLKSICTAYLDDELYHSIEQYALQALSYIKQVDLIEEQQTILHGDVVHHNFLRAEDGNVRLIDFDLATTGPESIELILWLHRVLPHVSYDLQALIEEQPSLKKLQPTHFLHLLYPNELLREWLHFMSLSEEQQQKNYAKIHAFTISALSHWSNLWYNVLQINN